MSRSVTKVPEKSLPETPKFDLGVEAVLSSLRDDESIKWIRGSHLTERAFLIGALKFAEANFPDQDHSKWFVLAFMETLWVRDDPFPCSEAGKLYSELRGRIESYCDTAIRGGSDLYSTEEILNNMSDLVDRFAEQNSSARDACRRSIDDIRQGLLEIQHNQAPNTEAIDEIFGIYRWLEEPLRYLTGTQAPKS